MKKLLSFDEYLKKKIKNPKFKAFYEKTLRKLELELARRRLGKKPKEPII